MAPILKEKIDKDLSEALKAKDEVRLGTLRMISSAIHNREIEKRTTSTKRGEKNFGRLMGEVMKRAGGRAYSSLASRLIKERLSK